MSFSDGLILICGVICVGFSIRRIGLYNFDTNAANTVNRINGMIFGLIIKFLQRKVSPPEDVINETLKEILSAIKANENPELQCEVRGLAEVMETFVPSMKNFSDATNAQSKIL